MARYSSHELWNAVEIANRVSNDPVSVVEETENDGPGKQFTVSMGRPADLIHGGEMSLDVNDLIAQTGRGNPDEIFVHAGDLAALTGCSLETGRRWLKQFHDHDLLVQHGDASTEEGGESHDVRLYLPSRVDRETVMRTLYELDGRSSPDSVQDLTPVTPGQFDHVENGVWRYSVDPKVTVDVSQSAQTGASLQDHVASQLRSHGLKPSSPKNFVYELRKKAGII
jgi:hypothetical protein